MTKEPLWSPSPQRIAEDQITAYPDWHLYTKGMDRFATPFSNWLEIPELL